MHLPVNPPVLPMLAKRVGELPAGKTWIFEPKWDGFRALVFRDGDEILIQSRDQKSLNRYFPELLETLRSQLPARCVLDGEIVIATESGLDFETLQLRIHPAASRVKLLSQQTPTSIVFFDLLCEGDRDLCGEPFEAGVQRWNRCFPPRRRQSTSRRQPTKRASRRTGFVASRAPVSTGSWPSRWQAPYEPDKRVMLKVKHERDCDCVVAGFRWYKNGEGTAVGSLLLGLFDDSGALQHVGVCASFTQEKRRELVEFLSPYREDALANHPWKLWADPGSATGEGEQRMPGGQSRWSQGKDLSWEPLRPELVVEVAYEHMQGSRFRHMAQFRSGAPISRRATAPMPSWKWFRRKS
jgi:ATP-dependent DNA ligase